MVCANFLLSNQEQLYGSLIAVAGQNQIRHCNNFKQGYFMNYFMHIPGHVSHVHTHAPEIASMVQIIPHHFRQRSLSSSICKASRGPRVPKVSSNGCAMAFFGAMEETGLRSFLTMIRDGWVAEAWWNLGFVEC